MKSNGNKKKITDELLAFWENIIFPYLQDKFSQIDKRFENLGKDIVVLKEDASTLKTDIVYVKNDLRDLKADTPTAKEFFNHEKRIKRLENTVSSPQ